MVLNGEGSKRRTAHGRAPCYTAVTYPNQIGTFALIAPMQPHRCDVAHGNDYQAQGNRMKKPFRHKDL
jgi:hypothetical protein